MANNTECRGALLNKESFEREYHPLKWKTAMSWEKDGIVTVIRIGRKRFLKRDEIERLMVTGRQFAGGWRRRTA